MKTPASMCLRVTILLLLLISVAESAPGKKERQKQKLQESEGALSELEFDAGADVSADEPLTPWESAENARATPDKDETPEGEQQIAEIEAFARHNKVKTDEYREKRLPLAIPRDQMLAEVRRLAEQNAGISDQLRRLHNDHQRLTEKRKRFFAGGPEFNALIRDLKRVTAQIQQLEYQGNLNQHEIDVRAPQIEALNNQIRPLDAELEKLWNEMNETRKQWLTLREPLTKYVRGDYQRLRDVLDDWLRLDGLWAHAYEWAALCEYELGRYDYAEGYVEKAAKITEQEFGMRRRNPEFNALRGMILEKSGGRNDKRGAKLLGAIDDLKTQNPENFFALFLLGRAHAARTNGHIRAAKFLKNALALKPGFIAAEMWLARVRTTNKAKNEEQLQEGIASLEKLYGRTGRRSWRVASFLADAYALDGQTEKAAPMLKVALAECPENLREGLKSSHEQLLLPDADKKQQRRTARQPVVTQEQKESVTDGSQPAPASADGKAINRRTTDVVKSRAP